MRSRVKHGEIDCETWSHVKELDQGNSRIIVEDYKYLRIVLKVDKTCFFFMGRFNSSNGVVVYVVTVRDTIMSTKNNCQPTSVNTKFTEKSDPLICFRVRFTSGGQVFDI